MRRITEPAEFDARTADPLLQWAAQDLRDDVRVWAHGEATAVTVTHLSGYDRLALTGRAEDATAIVAQVYGPGYRLIGDEDLVLQVCRRTPGFAPTRRFGWMDTTTDVAADPRAEPTTDDAAVTALLREAFPESTTWPGSPGIERWWVARQHGRIVACAAECYSSTQVGYLSGVASAPSVRGRGLGRAVVTTALHHLVRQHGRAALLAEEHGAARGLYESLGLRWRSLRAGGPS